MLSGDVKTLNSAVIGCMPTFILHWDQYAGGLVKNLNKGPDACLIEIL